MDIVLVASIFTLSQNFNGMDTFVISIAIIAIVDIIAREIKRAVPRENVAY